MSLVWEHYPVGGGELLTALAYADHAHDDGASVRPSIKHMARKTRQSERTIQMHVAAMRRTTWLQTVRHARGGRGRTTEYRINPAWISNPAGFAPFLAALETVQLGAEKGASDGGKGCRAFAPQPPRTIEPTTTSEKGRGAVSSVALVARDVEVIGLDEGPLVAYRDAILRAISSCPAELRQQVVDELAGMHEKGTIRTDPARVVRGLVEATARGTFTFAAGVAVAAARERSRLERERRAAEDDKRRRQQTPEALARNRAAAEAALARMAALRTGPAPSSSVVASTTEHTNRGIDQ